ncbi:UNVERIFIED_CONTAM: hypothetical protein K2H54_032360 [Gekko kuhli]
MFLMLALLFLGPGKRTTAVPKLQEVKCIVFNDDYMTCEWDSSQTPASNYSLYYWYKKDPTAECEHYLQSNGVNMGCWFSRSQIHLFRSFNVYLNTSNNGSSHFYRSRTMQLQDLVKPSPPVNLTIQSSGNNQLQVTWGSTYKAPHCLIHMVEHHSSTDTKSKTAATEEMKFILASVDPKKLYTFYVRSSEDKAMSVWFWIQNVLFPIGSLLLLILLFLTLIRMERKYYTNDRRVWLVLMPKIPNPSNKFEELFTAYQGNFSEWAGVPKDALESFKPSYRESICHVTELLPGGGYLPLGSDILGKAGEMPGVSVDLVSKTDIE